MPALGYYVAGGPEIASTSSFYRASEGYIWVFSAVRASLVEFCGKGSRASSLRKRLEQYLNQAPGSPGRAGLLTAICYPSLGAAIVGEEPGAARLDGGGRCGGPGGPSHGRGLVLRHSSADLAVRALTFRAGERPRKAGQYRQSLPRLRGDLEFGSRLARCSWDDPLRSVPDGMVQFTRRSRAFSANRPGPVRGECRPIPGIRKRACCGTLTGACTDVSMSLG